MKVRGHRIPKHMRATFDPNSSDDWRKLSGYYRARTDLATRVVVVAIAISIAMQLAVVLL